MLAPVGSTITYSHALCRSAFPSVARRASEELSLDSIRAAGLDDWAIADSRIHIGSGLHLEGGRSSGALSSHTRQ
jgi:hypothetical protein